MLQGAYPQKHVFFREGDPSPCDVLSGVLRLEQRAWAEDGEVRSENIAAKNIKKYRDALIEALTPRRRWIVRHADHEHLSSFTPAVTMMEVAKIYPGAADIFPEPEISPAPACR